MGNGFGVTQPCHTRRNRVGRLCAARVAAGIMARKTPTARDGILIVDGAQAAIPIGSDVWWRWLDTAGASAFRFERGPLRFTARREQHKNGWYLYGYRREGRLHKAYLGRSTELTLGRLESVAAALGRRGSASQVSKSDSLTATPPALGASSGRARSVSSAHQAPTTVPGGTICRRGHHRRVPRLPKPFLPHLLQRWVDGCHNGSPTHSRDRAARLLRPRKHRLKPSAGCSLATCPGSCFGRRIW